MRLNKGEYVRISHSMKAEKTPNFWSLMGRRKKKKTWGEKKK